MENEPIKVDEFEQADVFCSDCNGQLVALDIQKTNKLFSIQYYKKMVLQCNLCKKNGKVFTQKIKK